jgi:hypothetical protein
MCDFIYLFEFYLKKQTGGGSCYCRPPSDPIWSDPTCLPASVLPLAAAVAAVSTAAAAIFLRPGFVDIQRSTIEFPAIESGNRALRFVIRAHFHEPKASGSSGFPVCHDAHTIDRAIRLEHGSNRIFGSPEAEISYENILHLSLLSGICRPANRGQDRTVVPDQKMLELPDLSNYSYMMAQTGRRFNDRQKGSDAFSAAENASDPFFSSGQFL